MGDEVCWDFVELIATLKCNLSAFCNIMNAKYARRGEKAGKFVSPKTLRSLLFLLGILPENRFPKSL